MPLMGRTISLQQRLSLDDHFERLCLGGISERLVDIEDLVEFEAMRNEELGVDLFRADR
jgi:hypothetical protein